MTYPYTFPDPYAQAGIPRPPGLIPDYAPPNPANRSVPVAVRTNNPGNQWMGSSARKFGATSSANVSQRDQPAVFPDRVSGAAAMFNLLGSKNYRGKTIEEGIYRWAAGRNPAYPAFVEKTSGVPRNTVITPEFLQTPQGIAVAKAMAQYEAGYQKGAYPLSDEGWQKAQKMAFGSGHIMDGPTPQFAQAAPQSPFPDPQKVNFGPPVGGAPTPPESSMMTPTEPPAGMPRIPTPPQVSSPPPLTPQLADPAPPQAPMMGGAPFQGVPAGMPLIPPQVPMQPPMAPMAPPAPAPTMMADAGAASGSMPSLFGGSGGMLGGMGGMLGGLFGGGGGGASAPQAPAAPPPPMGLDPMVLALLAQQGPFKFPDFNQFA
jgi:hypothetical protein